GPDSTAPHSPARPAEAAPTTSRISTRWKIVGWIVLTTAVALLAVTVTTRSVLVTQVAERANASVVQEIDEYRTFAQEGVDPTTAEPFTSMDAMLERYLSRQTPESGETLIGVAGTDAATASVQFLDNSGGGKGRDLAQDPAQLQRMLDSDTSSGVWDAEEGQLRWGKATVISEADPNDVGTLIVAQFTAAELDEVERATLVLFGIALGGLLLTAGIAWLVAGRILKPLRDMREVTAHISAADLSARVSVEGNDEVAFLGHTLNEMLERVQEAQESQQAFTVQARRYLAAPRERVRDAIDVLDNEDTTPEERSAAALQARAGLEFMRRTMDSLGILARQHTPDFVSAEHVKLSDLAARLYTEAVQAHPEQRWELVEHAEGHAWVDPQRITEAIRQLTENAATHSPAGDPIKIGLSEHEENTQRILSVWVANRGEAISRETAEQVFQEFRRDGDKGTGMGFGLAVVRAVADAHEGSAWVESDPRLGSRFGLDIPADALAPRQDSAKRLGQDIVSSMGNES
ncbi:MAG: HAMP domain-containing sensor histidine kinase, partial [Micrococcus sp.]|nr:HAMP domain-containing sensor histidine kinase [Micrococcus sp.]